MAVAAAAAQQCPPFDVPSVASWASALDAAQLEALLAALNAGGGANDAGAGATGAGAATVGGGGREL